MKKLYLIIISLFLLVSIDNAQQLPATNQYLINPYTLSPCYTGVNANTEAYVGYRRAWMKVNNAPEVISASLFGTFRNRKNGLGLSLLKDQTSIFENFHVNLSYIHHLKISDDQFVSFNITAGAIGKNINLEDVKVEDWDDPLLTNISMQRGTSFSAGAGALYRYKGFSLGFMSPTLWESETYYGLYDEETENNNNVIQHIFLTHYTLHASYNAIELTNKGTVDILPFAVIRKTDNSPMNYEIAGLLRFKVKNSRFWGGATYRKNNIIGISAGMSYDNNLIFNFTYEMAGSKVLYEPGGTYEFAVGYRFGKGGQQKRIEEITTNLTKRTDSVINELKENEKEVRNQVDKLQNTTDSLENQLRNLKSQVSGVDRTSPDKESMARRIEELENQIYGVTTKRDKSITELSKEYGSDFFEGRVFYVIVGAFGNKNNLDKWVTNLKSKGLHPSVFYNSKRKLSYVYLLKTTKWQDAVYKKEAVQGIVSRVWIYYE